MDNYIALATVFVSGLFGLAVATVSSKLARGTERSRQSRASAERRCDQVEALYLDEMIMLEKYIRLAQRVENLGPLLEELSRNNARLRLFSTEVVRSQASVAGDLLDRWADEYRAGAPKPIKGIDAAIISSHDTPHREAADKLFPTLCEEILKLADMMRQHLNELRAGVDRAS